MATSKMNSITKLRQAKRKAEDKKRGRQRGDDPFPLELDDEPNAVFDAEAVRIAKSVAESLGGIDKLKEMFPDMAALLEESDGQGS